jgi:GTA TIM-barrel-like domain/Putative phage tail protein
MATLLLAGLGSAIGGSIGGTFLGVSSAVIGQSIGTVIGSVIDQALFASTTRVNQEGPRLTEASALTSVEGVTIARGYGRFRVSGNIIWASRFREDIVTETSTTGGKGNSGGVETTTTTYNYYANFAVGLCEGPIQGIHRVWVDGKLLDLSEINYRVYRGTNSQNPDSLIETKEGAGNVPAYRGLAYIVFEDMLINEYGNRIPQMNIEVTRPIRRDDNNSVGDLINAIDLIPGSGEFVYEPNVVEKVIYGDDDEEDEESREIENAHSSDGRSDWETALDQMESNLPNCTAVNLVVTWFGTDIRIGHCEIRPCVETDDKNTDPYSWLVAGLTRETADVLPQITYDSGSTGPAFGGTPNDASVFRAIQDLKDRGFEVMFYPFMMLDITASNTLPDPYSDNAAGVGQPRFPWRGRITCSPAPGYVGTVDQTATAATQVSNFLGTADASDFSGSGGEVTYSGPDEWSYRRFILHMAELCRQAGGVDYFCIGSEMVGATSIRSDSNSFPFVTGLINLAAEVATLLPSAKLGYAADWSEYHSYRPSDGSNDVYFNLDPLWSDSNIDFIGIDNYMPLSDWRDSDTHQDYLDGYESIYDLDYLKANIEGGEYYDWYYSSANARLNQNRTEIVDTGYGKHWVFRQKDIKNWWSHSHYNRPGGVEAGSPTAWTPESKKIIITEFGCPSIDKGTNQPNVFYDPKSSESFIPYFSSGGRDDDIQRQYIRAFMEYWTDNSNNPSSGVYSGRMIDPNRIFYWCYDARPWPTFPGDDQAWGDQANWQFGHWISSKIDTVYIPDLLDELASDYNVTADYDFSRAYGSCDGFILTSKTSFRSAIEPLCTMFTFDIIESGDQIKAVSKQESQKRASVTADDILDTSSDDNTEPVTLARSQASELPRSMTIKYIDVLNDYEVGAASQTRSVGDTESDPISDTPVVLDYSRAQQMADKLLYYAWSSRTSGEFGLLPEFLYLEPGDVVEISEFDMSMRIETITDSTGRQITAKSFDRNVFSQGGQPSRTISGARLSNSGYSSIIAAFLDVPMINSGDNEHQPYVAAYMKPWPKATIYKSLEDSNYQRDTIVFAPSIIGKTTDTFHRGEPDIWDNDNELKVRIYRGTLETQTELEVLAGANTIAVETSADHWELVQFVNAELTGTKQYTLTKLLRGQKGTEDAIVNSLAAGARVVFLSGVVQQMGISLDTLNKELNIKYGPSNKDIGDSSYKSTTKTFVGRGLMPYSPVHVSYSVAGGGDITISWIRRTRINGDSWNYTGDVPLNEAFEKYEVDILDGSDEVVRTLSVTNSTSVVYDASDQSSDGISAPFDVIIYQMSDQVGRGVGRRTTIDG